MTLVSHRQLAAVPPAAAPTIDMPGLSRMLGIEYESATSRRHTSPASRVRYVQALIDGHKFPKPLPHMGSEGLEDAISYRKSRWLRAPVDAWLYGANPPQLGDTSDSDELRAAAARMDAAAENVAA